MDYSKFSQSRALAAAEPLNFFEIPDTNVAYSLDTYEKVCPLYPVENDRNPVTFIINPSTNGYLDLADSFIYITARIYKKDGSKLSKLTPADKVAPENLFFHALFSEMTIDVNGARVSSANGLYAYQSYIQTQLSKSIGSKSSQLSAQVYYKETAKDDFSDSNSSFKTRLSLAENSKLFEMIGKPIDGLFQMNKFLPNNATVQIELTRSDPDFCLSASEGEGLYTIAIQNANLYARRISVNPKILSALDTKLNQSKVLSFPFESIQVRSYEIPSGCLQKHLDTIHYGPLPKILIIGLVSSISRHGALNKTPFNFKPYDIQSLKVTVNKKPIVFNEIKLDFDGNEYMLGYNTIFKALRGCSDGNDISYLDYKNGNTFFVFKMDDSTEEFQGLPYGTLEGEIFFSNATTELLTVIVYEVFDALLQIDGDGKTQVIQQKLVTGK